MPRRGVARSQQKINIEWGETVGQNENRELVPLKSDFDVVWYGFRRSQVKFYIEQTEAEMRMLSEDRDSAMSQVADLSAQLDQARAEVESLRQQLDEIARTPIEESALSDRLRRMVRLANDEAKEIVSSAQAAAEHEWARSEQSAAELRTRYENLVAEADQWRRQSEVQRNEALAQTREDIQRMTREAEQHRRRQDAEAEERRTQVETDFEISMAARRDEAMRVIAEREQASRNEAQRRVREATSEANRRLRRADEYAETMLRMRQEAAEQVRNAQRILAAAEPFLAATEDGAATEASDGYVAGQVQEGTIPANGELEVPKQRTAPAKDAGEEQASEEAERAEDISNDPAVTAS